MSDCTLMRESMPMLLTESLDPARRETAHQHIEHCAACGEEWAGYRETWSLLETLPELEVPPRVKQQFMSYVNPQAAPTYLETDFTCVSPTLHLLEHAPLTEASYTIEACLPSAKEAKALDIRTSDPCLVMVRRTVSGANVASVARQLYPGSRYSFAGQFQA